MLSLKHHGNLLRGIGCQDTGLAPHCTLTKVEGVGGRVTISRTGENWRPRGPAFLNGVCVRGEEDRQAGKRAKWWGELLAVGV